MGIPFGVGVEKGFRLPLKPSEICRATAFPLRLRGRARVGACATSVMFVGFLRKALLRTTTPTPTLPRAAQGREFGALRDFRFQTASRQPETHNPAQILW
ncbi:hypothetical protein HMPREF9120_01747 [Neisseria sp. oral taxon 020 str. F0370]|nr:hypothetical protein HMPREF9120_01747 [Neisseria sp. oral taxon 020 str. F0370]